MNKKIRLLLIVLCIFAGTITSVFAQKRAAMDEYRRSSLYSLALSVPSMKYSAEIDSVFLFMPFPDKYENHNLSVRLVTTETAKTDLREVESFLYENAIARRMVSKWFGRTDSGTFDINLIAERGLYNASELDVNQALLSKRGTALLSDAGQELLQNSFVIINEISYIDKEKNAQIASSIFKVLAVTAAAVAIGASGDDGNASSIAAVTSAGLLLGGAISSTIAGFTVKVRSNLYKLDWNDSVAAVFYRDYWCDKSSTPELIAQRKALYDSCTVLFKLTPIGSYKSKSQKTVLRGLHSNYDVIRKVCTRALDKNIAELQKEFEVFKLKTPVYSIDGKYITAMVGMKEGIKSNSKFEVLQTLEDENGKTSYKRVGVVKAVKNQIWDNRYMAHLEDPEASSLKATQFKKSSGIQFLPGMLIRQIK